MTFCNEHILGLIDQGVREKAKWLDFCTKYKLGDCIRIRLQVAALTIITVFLNFHEAVFFVVVVSFHLQLYKMSLDHSI